jgi:ParB family chromosome partitioning protein
MKLDFIDISKLSVSKANMRYAKKAPDVSDILPTVRARGVLVPVIVRATCEPDAFEIVAGARRFHAAQIVAGERRAEGHQADPLPCAILGAGDDAAAIEVSLIENLARLDPDEVSRWETFTRLIKEGRTPSDIAATFGLPDLAVKRVLALGNLIPRIRDLYRKAEIDAATVRLLTLASRAQQRDWLALRDDPEAYAPTGQTLRAWLCGGQSIKASHALFDVEAAGCATVSDLFGEDRYFADPAAFWTAQNAAIEAKRSAYLEAGWSDVVIVGAGASAGAKGGEHFHSWNTRRPPSARAGASMSTCAAMARFRSTKAM